MLFNSVISDAGGFYVNLFDTRMPVGQAVAASSFSWDGDWPVTNVFRHSWLGQKSDIL